MSPHQQIVLKQLNAWRDLKAWGKSLRSLDLTVSEREYHRRAGTAWPALNKVNVYHQPGLRGIVGMLKTGLHEFAHIVTPDSHGPLWQSVYSKAVEEVTGIITRTGDGLDQRCYNALLKWWRASGNEAKARAYVH